MMELLPLAELLATRRAAWEALIDAAPQESFFQRAEWLAAWSNHATERRESLVALSERDGALTAGLPIQLGVGTIGRWRLRKVELAGAPWLDRVDVPRVDEHAGAALLAALLDHLVDEKGAGRRSWTVLDFREASRDGFAVTTLARLADERRLRCERRVCSRAPTWDIVASGTRAPSANLRSQLARGGKRLAAAGRVEIAFVAPQPAEVAALLDECADVERASWKGRTATGILAQPAPAALFRPLFAALAASGRFALATLRVDGKLHAYHLGFRHAGRFLSYNLANRPDFEEHGPGTLLLQAMIEGAHELAITVMDASRGELERPHLLHRYGGPLREHEQLLIWRPGTRGAAVHLARTQLLPRLRSLQAKVRANGAAPKKERSP